MCCGDDVRAVSCRAAPRNGDHFPVFLLPKLPEGLRPLDTCCRLTERQGFFLGLASASVAVCKQTRV